MKRFGVRKPLTGWFPLIALLTLFAFTWVAVFPQEVVSAEKIVIQGGTLVLLRIVSDVTPDLQAGDKVGFVITQDVVIDDKVVIKAGTQATGEVTASKKGGIVGIPGRIEIAVKYVEAVDKTSVPISGSKTVEGEDKLIAGIVLGVLCLPLIFVVRGGTPRISAGTMIDATVSMPTTITLK